MFGSDVLSGTITYNRQVANDLLADIERQEEELTSEKKLTHQRAGFRVTRPYRKSFL